VVHLLVSSAATSQGRSLATVVVLAEPPLPIDTGEPPLPVDPGEPPLEELLEPPVPGPIAIAPPAPVRFGVSPI
jgi:hypothetical protein